MDMRIFLISTRKINFMDGGAEGLLVMPFDLLREVTNDFSEERKLGSGSFGKVYKGVHQDGVKIAVKMLYDMPGLDDELFQNEFKNLTRLRHQNIVRLVGYCHDIQVVQVMHEGKLVLAEKTHRALCLEYMSNGSLDKYLSGNDLLTTAQSGFGWR
ncbi:putative receptor-like protein kinase At4g00960 [Hordeum vulgare subsp. vulgare]|uniref:putative receptor-like protein kinase At4g00960 n=1 Tax=Hordeum vulgare subsp. vulgare TaxID=112509 RepID=UPI000B47FDAE|nr:putative receptor-like protein kinase At4g00960 [Hordeum vulgare subsp. vulgare]